MLRTFCTKSLALPFCVILLVLGTRPAIAADTHFQFAELHLFGTDTDVAGGGTLVRTKRSITARLAMTDLEPNAAYSVWWVVFNDPENCSDPCNADDERSVLNATGFVTGSSGTANVTAHLDAGNPPNGQEVLLPPTNPLLTDSGLKSRNGLAAEVHMVVRTHGSPVVGEVGSQIATFLGACDINACRDTLAIAFSPVSKGKPGDDDDDDERGS